MQQVNDRAYYVAPQAPVSRDPAPSRWRYRYTRVLLTPLFWVFLKVGIPGFFAAMIVMTYLTNGDARNQMSMALTDARAQVQNRPEFLINAMTIQGASPNLAQEIHGATFLDFPISAFDVDVEVLSKQIQEIPAVNDVFIRLGADGLIDIKVEEAHPVVNWQARDGNWAISPDGTALRQIESSSLAASLPLIGGEKANENVAQAMQIFQATLPIAREIKGLVYIGERRWDIVFQDGRTVMLPEVDPIASVSKLMILVEGQDILAHDFSHLDFRNPDRIIARKAKSNENANISSALDSTRVSE